MSDTDNNPIRRAMMLAPMMAFKRANGKGIYSVEPQNIRGVTQRDNAPDGEPVCAIAVQTGEDKVFPVEVFGDALEVTQKINEERSDFLRQMRYALHG